MVTAIEAAQSLVAHGLQRESAALVSAGVSALAAVANDQQDFMLLLQQCAAGDELASLVRLARTLIKKFPRRARVVDWAGPVHLVTQVVGGRFRVELAELELAAMGQTAADARSALLRKATTTLDRLWSSYSGHKLTDGAQVEVFTVEANLQPRK